MSESIGHGVKMSRARRFICDLLHAGMQVPLVTIQKDMNVADLIAARKGADPRPSWCAIFTKAYGKMVASRPDMRRACLTVPWLRMFEYHATSADVTIEVNHEGENCLAFVKVRKPESLPLLEFDRIIAAAWAKPMKLHSFQDALFLARFPQWLRRFALWFILNVSGRLRARYFSTFGVTSVGNWGVESVKPIAPAISILQYGAIAPDGKVSIRMTYDHRVLDGSGPSTALNEMEQFLKTEILAEVKALPAVGAGACQSDSAKCVGQESERSSVEGADGVRGKGTKARSSCVTSNAELPS
ncbi:MAG: hypothetical protein EXR98_03700 [Gemmataceae bacterium]|nr:hypothetical protein [Gemmataceae bacterium]